ncbi:DUF1376 domain-containing protein [Novacetimonas pomaceti]|uniref:DUF1376 domain-containing protein n=1 Tax=Novacetimonas pomaceti TaxID=2021998 RepID=A0ABX5P2V8_9PROT|nr:DUF1376 domain-containing protein [Novacetimonas pomaceti]PYD47148.1 hypothetical protein C3920_11500 [Novacetimonas pomaceti]
MTAAPDRGPVLPAPLSPPDCDLRGYDFMPLFGHRLFSGRLYTHCTDAEFRAAVRLWWSAWNQVPAGSLPADDRALATLADFGRDLRAWRRVRARALDGFVTCSDGRLYHPLLSREATRAHAGRLRAQRRRDGDAERLRRWRAGHAGTAPDTPDAPDDMAAGTPPVPVCTPDVKRVSPCDDSDSDRERESDSNTSAARATARPPQGGAPVMADLIARTGDLTGRGMRQARALTGQWMKAARDDTALVDAVLRDGLALRPADPVAWVLACLRQRTGDGPTGREARRQAHLAAWDAIPDLRGI